MQSACSEFRWAVVLSSARRNMLEYIFLSQCWVQSLLDNEEVLQGGFLGTILNFHGIFLLSRSTGGRWKPVNTWSLHACFDVQGAEKKQQQLLCAASNKGERRKRWKKKKQRRLSHVISYVLSNPKRYCVSDSGNCRGQENFWIFNICQRENLP